MEKFEDISISGKERSVKIGKNVPNGALGLSWFSSQDVTPKNHIYSIDMSDTIPENRLLNEASTQIMYADELGFLRNIENNSPTVPTNDITIANSYISKPVTNSYISNISDIDKNDFAHYVYVSRYFVAAPTDYGLISIDDYQGKVPKNIKVYDSSGNEYVDKISGKLKYRILLEPFSTLSNSQDYEIPHRIIILFDASEPINLTLIYDKIVADENGIVLSQQIKYSENINASTIFEEVPEEAYLLDPNYKNKKIFSIKKKIQKNSALTTNQITSSGYQVMVPDKAISDNRTFETFNWRFIGKNRRQFSSGEFNYGINVEGITGTSTRNVRAGVLYSSAHGLEADKNPFVFYRLQNSPFNLSKFNYINPLITNSSIAKNSKEYWLVDIDTQNITSTNSANNFDILVWKVSNIITADQAVKVINYLNNNGTIILDLSETQSYDAASRLDSRLEKSTYPLAANNMNLNASSQLLSAALSGGFTINSSIFNENTYNILGNSVVHNTSTLKEFPLFNSASITADSKILSIGASTTTLYPIAVLLKYTGTSSSPTQGNLIATTFSFLDYCNDTYNSLGQSTKNEDTVQITSNQQTFVDYLEGPFKFLYNSVAYALYSRAHATFTRDNRSPLYTYLSPWKFSWTMNSSALLKEEKLKDFVQIAESSNYGKKILLDTSRSVMADYKESLLQNLPNEMRNSLNNITDSSIDIYIECTNADVIFSNATAVTASEADIPSQYSLYKITNKNAMTYAYTNVASPLFSDVVNMGANMIIEKSYELTNMAPMSSVPITSISSLKKYNFDLYSRYYYNNNSETSISTNIGVNLLFDVNVTASGIKITPPVVGETRTGVPINSINIQSAIDNLGLLRAGKSSVPENNFIYTGDIDAGNSNKWWKQGTSGDYVRYIQYSLVADGITVNGKAIKVDGIFGSQTKQAVTAFQEKYNLRYKDGSVDSETKSYFAKSVWQEKSVQEYSDFISFANATGNSAATKYMDAARNAVSANNINVSEYKKISFTGFEGPGEVRDIIFFSLAEDSLDFISSIEIEFGEWQNVVVESYGYSGNYSADIFQYQFNLAGNRRPEQNIVSLSIPDQQISSCKHFWISIKGGKLPVKYGYAEGFSIKRIYCKGSTTGEVIDPDDIPVTKNVSLKCVLTDNYYGVNPANPVTKSYNDFNSINNRSSIIVTQIDNATYSEETQIKLVDILSNPSNVSEFIQAVGSDASSVTCQLSSISVNTASISTVSNGTLDYFVCEKISNSTVKVYTDTTQYNNTIVLTPDTQIIAPKYINDENVEVSLGEVTGITVLDGVIRLANSDGSPYGIPTTSSIPNESSIANADVSYGLIYISNRVTEDSGLIYGFYDNLEKLFLGKAISHRDILERGVSNIYIAVAALDADGNLAQSRVREYIGSSSPQTFIPARIPIKLRSPIYSVNLKPRTAIGIEKISENMDRHSAWGLSIRPGSFTRKFILKSLGEKNTHEWMRNYFDQTLYLTYSTIDISEGNWSKIFGTGYYDIFDETPTIISTRIIKTKMSPIISWKEKTNYQSAIIGRINPQIFIYTRDSITSDWELVPRSSIRNINCYTGEVEFISNIVPTNDALIKVSYVVKKSSLNLLQINGNPVPLNPVLNKNIINFNKPLYIYIMPESIYKLSSNSSSATYVRVSEYTLSSSINFTYDNSLFSEKSDLHNPFALLLAVIYVVDNPNNIIPEIDDIRVRGGGIKDSINYNDLVTSMGNVGSYWDVYPPQGQAYNKGGYVIVQIPEAVKQNFLSKDEIYEIIRNNLTAGISFDVQDESGNDW